MMLNKFSFEVQNVSKKYGKSEVLRNIKMEFQGGQFVSLMGKNGSGKSTLMRLLAKEELATTGNVLFQGQSLSKTDLDLNSSLVFISEDHDLPFHVPLSWWAQRYRSMYPDYDQSFSDRLLKSLEITLDKPFSSLSRGQKMKALFAIQAPKKPMCYFLDEITAVLDAGSRWTLMQFLKEESERGALVLMSTNIASEMNGFATNLFFLEQGRLVFSSDCKKLGDFFKKIRISGSAEEIARKKVEGLGGKRIQFNSDNTWTYLIEYSKVANLGNLNHLDDNREVTVSDVQYYFTGGEGSL